MPRVIVALFRHGSYDQPEGVPSAHLPYPLNETGQAQALEGVTRLVEAAGEQGWEFDPVIDCSTLLRAWHTARIVSQGLSQHEQKNFPVEPSEALTERCVGSAANMTVEQIDSVLRQDPRCTSLPSTWQRDPTYKLPFPGAESLMQAGARVARYLEERARQITQRVQRDTVKVVVGHGGSFRHAAVHLGVLSLEEVSTLSMHHCTPVFLERIDSERWAHVAGQWKLRQPVGASD